PAGAACHACFERNEALRENAAQLSRNTRSRPERIAGGASTTISTAVRARNVQLIGRSMNTIGLPWEMTKARRRFSSSIGPRMKPSSKGRRLAAQVLEEIAQEPEQRGQQHVERVAVDAVDADAAHQQDRRIEQAVGHGQELHPDAD